MKKKTIFCIRVILYTIIILSVSCSNPSTFEEIGESVSIESNLEDEEIFIHYRFSAEELDLMINSSNNENLSIDQIEVTIRQSLDEPQNIIESLSDVEIGLIYSIPIIQSSMSLYVQSTVFDNETNWFFPEECVEIFTIEDL